MVDVAFASDMLYRHNLEDKNGLAIAQKCTVRRIDIDWTRRMDKVMLATGERMDETSYFDP